VACGKTKPKVTTAIARELAAFIWAMRARWRRLRNPSRGQDVVVHWCFRRPVTRWRILESVKGVSFG